MQLRKAFAGQPYETMRKATRRESFLRGADRAFPCARPLPRIASKYPKADQERRPFMILFAKCVPRPSARGSNVRKLLWVDSLTLTRARDAHRIR